MFIYILWMSCFLLQFCESDLVLRSRVTHTSHCAHLEGPLHDHFATTYGVSYKSVLNESKFFHVVDGMIPDIMHDVLEGSLQLHIKWLLKHCIIHMKYFSINILMREFAHSILVQLRDQTDPLVLLQMFSCHQSFL